MSNNRIEKEKQRLGYAAATWLEGSKQAKEYIQAFPQQPLTKLYSRFENADKRFFLAAIQNTTRCDARYLMPWRGLREVDIRQGFTFIANYSKGGSPLLYAEMEGRISDLPYLYDAYQTLNSHDGKPVLPAESLDATERQAITEFLARNAPAVTTFRYALPLTADLLQTEAQAIDRCSCLRIDGDSRLSDSAVVNKWKKLPFATRSGPMLRMAPRVAHFELYDRFSKYRLRVYGAPAKAVVERVLQIVARFTPVMWSHNPTSDKHTLTLTGRSNRDVLLSTMIDYSQSQSKKRRGRGKSQVEKTLPFDSPFVTRQEATVTTQPLLPFPVQQPAQVADKQRLVVENQTTGDYRRLRFMLLDDADALQTAMVLDMSQPAPHDVAAFIEWFNKR